MIAIVAVMAANIASVDVSVCQKPDRSRQYHTPGAATAATARYGRVCFIMAVIL